MIVLGAILVGAIIGAGLAHKRGGKMLDKLQYGAGFGIALGILGLFITVFLNRAY
ncbi:hypothetical protein [Pseudorhodobacter turbinis]|uniref:hypothetical protein n=1 Tax=Pseudorhodobacter turbinis TaxID=2500533 RepID=UPI00143D8DAB|nr:hypothetical protein [Pseudorhodobacter turbinis]